MRVKIKNLFYEIIKRDIKLALTNKYKIFYTFIFFIISSIILRISNNQQSINIPLGISFFSIIYIFSLILNNKYLLNDEFDNDLISQYILTGIELEIIIIAKWIAYVITIVVPTTLYMPICIYILCDQIINITLTSEIFIFSLNISLILFYNIFLLSDCKELTIFIILTLPFCIPNIILLLLAHQNYNCITIFIGLFFFYFPTSIILTNLSIKITIES